MAGLNFPQNFRTISRIDAPWLGRLTLVAVVMVVFLSCLLISRPKSLFGLSEQSILGTKKGPGVDLKDLLNQASGDIEAQRIGEAREKLSIVLAFEPKNAYAMEMTRKIQVQLDELEAEIVNTLSILDKQPNWKEAWLKLGDLYERAGNMELASGAREKARGLKTS